MSRVSKPKRVPHLLHCLAKSFYLSNECFIKTFHLIMMQDAGRSAGCSKETSITSCDCLNSSIAPAVSGPATIHRNNCERSSARPIALLHLSHIVVLCMWELQRNYSVCS